MLPLCNAVGAEHSGRTCPCNAAVRLQARTGKEGRMLKIAWRNPHPPARTALMIEEVLSDELPSAPTWVIFYRTIVASGAPENESQLLVNRIFGRPIAG